MVCDVEMVDENWKITFKSEHKAEVGWRHADQRKIIPSVRGVCFDTTASNAGRIKGAAIVLQSRCVG